MGDKPSYLGLLNAIAVAEAGGAQLFTAWAANTANPEVRSMLQTVALREAEHSISFAKRIDELGYSVIDRPDPTLAARIKTVQSNKLGDQEKFEKLGFGMPRPDVFAKFFDDTRIDIATGELLGRYIAEERDSARRIDACYASLTRSADSGQKKKATATAKKAKRAKKPTGA